MHHKAKHCIDQQKRRVNKELDSISRQLCTYSSYSTMPRSVKRVVEYHCDAAEREATLQRNLVKASHMASRIANVTEQLMRDFRAIKDHVGSYTFANTSGPDSSATGDCSEDLTHAIDTREAWKQQLCCLIGLASNYVTQQRLGDYAILHTPSSSEQACCPVGYRSSFTYSAPRGDCLNRKTKTVVSNPDLAIDQLYTMLCKPITVEGEAWPESNEAWYDFFASIISATSSTEEAAAALLAAGLSQELIDVMSAFINVHIVVWNSGDTTSLTNVYSYMMMFDPQLDNGEQWSDMEDYFPTLVPSSSEPAVSASIVGECDSNFEFVRQTINSKVVEIRALQLTNDSEQKAIEYMRNASERNKAYHEQAASEATSIDVGELKKRKQVGESILADLDSMGGSACYIKKT